MHENEVASLERVTRNTPLQFFGQPAAKNDPSQLLEFCLPLLGPIEVKINFWIRGALGQGMLLQSVYQERRREILNGPGGREAGTGPVFGMGLPNWIQPGRLRAMEPGGAYFACGSPLKIHWIPYLS